MKDIAYIVRDEIVAKMDNTIKVKSISGNDLTICGGLKWVAVLKIVKDNLDNEYRVTDVDTVTNIVTTEPLGAYSFTGKLLYLNRPHFFTGTPVATDTEWTKYTEDESDKTPFIWMVEPTSESVLDDQDSSIERNSNIHIVFLDTNNVEDWLTLDTHAYRLQALYNMRTEFINAVKKNTLFQGISNSTVRNITKFGTEKNGSFQANIIAANLTGVDNRLTLSIYKEDDCNC